MLALFALPGVAFSAMMKACVYACGDGSRSLTVAVAVFAGLEFGSSQGDGCGFPLDERGG